jgi:hypothetical protein
LHWIAVPRGILGGSALNMLWQWERINPSTIAIANLSFSTFFFLFLVMFLKVHRERVFISAFDLVSSKFRWIWSTVSAVLGFVPDFGLKTFCSSNARTVDSWTLWRLTPSRIRVLTDSLFRQSESLRMQPFEVLCLDWLDGLEIQWPREINRHSVVDFLSFSMKCFFTKQIFFCQTSPPKVHKQSTTLAGVLPQWPDLRCLNIL